MNTADVWEPLFEQTIVGQAEIIARSWRYNALSPTFQHWADVDPESAKRGRENALNTRKARKRKAA